MVKVLFVCLGNICRSPSAQGVFERLLEEEGISDQIYVDSAGTGSWHVGEPPDPRAQRMARARGIDISRQRARQVKPKDFHDFDYIIAMDRGNLRNLQSMNSDGRDHKIKLLLDFAPELGESEVPDPYFGGEKGFEYMFDLIDAAARGLLDDMREKHFVKRKT